MPTNTKQQLCIKPTGFLVNYLTPASVVLIEKSISLLFVLFFVCMFFLPIMVDYMRSSNI